VHCLCEVSLCTGSLYGACSNAHGLFVNSARAYLVCLPVFMHRLCVLVLLYLLAMLRII
jgi:hypothetical protein